MVTIVEFRLLLLDSLKYSSHAESPINRSAKAFISRNLTTSRHNRLFICLFIYLLFICLFIYLLLLFSISFSFYFILLYYSILFYFIYFIFHIFTEKRNYRLICIALATVVIAKPEWIKNIYLYFYLRRLNLAILFYFDKHL